MINFINRLFSDYMNAVFSTIYKDKYCIFVKTNASKQQQFSSILIDRKINCFRLLTALSLKYGMESRLKQKNKQPSQKTYRLDCAILY